MLFKLLWYSLFITLPTSFYGFVQTNLKAIYEIGFNNKIPDECV